MRALLWMEKLVQAVGAPTGTWWLQRWEEDKTGTGPQLPQGQCVLLHLAEVTSDSGEWTGYPAASMAKPVPLCVCPPDFSRSVSSTAWELPRAEKL